MIPTTEVVNICVEPARTLDVAGESVIDCVPGSVEDDGGLTRPAQLDVSTMRMMTSVELVTRPKVAPVSPS